MDNAVLLGRPPTTNQLYFIMPDGSRRMTRDYRDWRRFAAQSLRKSMSKVDGYAKVTVYANVNRRTDIDNILKPVCDALQDADRIKNDNLIDDIRAVRLQDVWLPKDMIAVKLEPLEENDD